MELTIGLAQIQPKIGDVAANLKTHLEIVETAKAQGVQELFRPRRLGHRQRVVVGQRRRLETHGFQTQRRFAVDEDI